MTERIGKLIVVDDEVDMAEFVVDVADDIGFDADFISDPTEFGKYYSNDIGLYVFDLFMPNVDGIELLRFLSENKSKASVIFMSGKDASVLKSATELARSLGVNILGSIEKPFRANELEELLSKYKPINDDDITVLTRDAVVSEQDLDNALLNSEFSLVYQPQINIESGALIGVEALIRWTHPTKGFVSPATFIPLAEQSGHIIKITDWVVRTALEQIKEWHAHGLDIRVSLNFSTKCFSDLDLPEKLSGLVSEFNVPFDKVVIEVTETALHDDEARYIDVITRLHMKGFLLSIDDFGTGYSSLLQLVQGAFHELKIDQAFIKNCVHDRECQAITEISVLLAHKLGMYVVAEGIEDAETLQHLKELGCEEAQGYFIAKPMPAQDVLSWANIRS